MINGIKTIGIIGGGQLGKMMILEAKRLGFKIVTLDPARACPSRSISDEYIKAGFESKAGFLRLAGKSDVVTYEFEHVDVRLLKILEKNGKRVFPSVESLSVIQDKLWQKDALLQKGIPVPEFAAVNDRNDIYVYYDRNKKPFFLKSRRGGYDGKGNFFVKNREDIETGFEYLEGKKRKLMVEAAVDFEKEVSVIAVRGQNGECAVYPIAENVHKNSILDTTRVPAAISKKTEERVMEISKQVMDCFNGVGTFCTELFVNEKAGVFFVNEVAPRVHNTGHYTIEACRVNQFENHIRAITGLDLGSPEMTVGAAIMKNVIGGQDGKARFAGVEGAYKVEGVNAHIYGKEEVTRGRKMGHFTVTGRNLAECAERAERVNIVVAAMEEGLS